MALSIAASGHFLGNDGPWSTFIVRVGSPPQLLEVLPASSASLTLAVLGEGCPLNAPAGCKSDRGNIFENQQSSTWENLTAENGPQYVYVTLPAEQPLLSEGIAGEISLDSLSLDWVGNISGEDPMPLEGQLIAAYAAESLFLGSLGLSGFQAYPVKEEISYQSTLQTLKNKSAVSGLTWAYTAGANYKTPESFGSLTFGGYDSSLINMDEALTGVDFPRGINGNGNELTLTIRNITIGDETLEAPELVALLDSMLPDIWLPRSTCDIFADKFDLQWNDDFEMYLMGTDQHQRLQKENTSVSFDLASNDTSDKVVRITLPFAAFDREAKYPLANITDGDSTLHYFPLKRMPNDTTQYKGLLGRTFFQEAWVQRSPAATIDTANYHIRYVSADYEQQKFNVGQALFPTGPQINLVPIYPPESAPVPSKSLGAGAIAGIAVGAFVLISVIAGLAWWLRRRRRRRESLAKETRTTRTVSVDEITLATLDPGFADRSEYYKPPQELVGEAKEGNGTPGFTKFELDANATATGPTGQRLERHELEAGSVHYRPGHRHNLSFGSSQSGISPMGAGDRISDVFGEPSPPLALSSGAPSPPLSDRRLERHGSPFPPFEMP